MPDIELIHAEIERRKHTRYKTLSQTFTSWTVALLLLYFGFIEDSNSSNQNIRTSTTTSKYSTFISQLGYLKDTLYTFMPSFMEINLDSQKLYHHWKNGQLDTFNISTGTSRLNKGKETTEGVFVIQSKIDWLYSLQFDSAKVSHWLGFNYGIGFHSLDGNRYYSNLGKRASSHGCVRLSREDAQHLYKCIDIGTPVIVHKSNFARVISFIDDPSCIDTTYYSKYEIRNVFRSKLKSLYQGEKFFYHYPTIPLTTKSITHDGLEIGDAFKIPRKQKVPPFYNEFVIAFSEHTFKKIKHFEPFLEANDIIHKTDIENQILP